MYDYRHLYLNFFGCVRLLWMSVLYPIPPYKLPCTRFDSYVVTVGSS